MEIQYIPRIGDLSETVVGDKLEIKWETCIGDKSETVVGDLLEIQ